MNRTKILIVDDQKSSRDLFFRLLDPVKYEPLTATTVTEAEDIIRNQRPDLVVTDLCMPKVDGMEGLSRFRHIDPDLSVIMITAFATVETAVEAIKRGAFDMPRHEGYQGEGGYKADQARSFRLNSRQLLEETR